METLYKVLHEDGKPYHGGTGQWSLPQAGKPGDWMPPIEGELIPCQSGYHLCRIQDLFYWLGPAIFEAECRGERLDCDNKVVVREARLLSKTAWSEKAARLFAADCAEHVLPIYEQYIPDDDRPRNAIDVVRRFANGLATREELIAAWDAAWATARDAAWDAAWVAARDAARDAAWVAARVAARDAAWVAAWVAARDAARDAAWDAERQWQQERLAQYLQGEPRET